MSKRTKKHRKNVARGGPLRSYSGTRSGVGSKSISRLRKTAQSAKSTRRRVKIYTPENEILEYTLGSSEKEMKQKSPIRGIPICKNPKYEEDFPCKMKRTVFKNKKDYDRFKRLKTERNESTGYKSRGEHYDEIDELLMSQGYTLLRK